VLLLAWKTGPDSLAECALCAGVDASAQEAFKQVRVRLWFQLNRPGPAHRAVEGISAPRLLSLGVDAFLIRVPGFSKAYERSTKENLPGLRSSVSVGEPKPRSERLSPTACLYFPRKNGHERVCFL
jgi:hypothetical protein